MVLVSWYPDWLSIIRKLINNHLEKLMTMISETVTPSGLRERAKIMRGLLDEGCARHLELAADEIERLRETLQEVDRLASRHAKGAIGIAQGMARRALHTNLPIR